MGIMMRNAKVHHNNNMGTTNKNCDFSLENIDYVTNVNSIFDESGSWEPKPDICTPLLSSTVHNLKETTSFCQTPSDLSDNINEQFHRGFNRATRQGLQLSENRRKLIESQQPFSFGLMDTRIEIKIQRVPSEKIINSRIEYLKEDNLENEEFVLDGIESGAGKSFSKCSLREKYRKGVERNDLYVMDLDNEERSVLVSKKLI